jgi:hypothetical protein
MKEKKAFIWIRKQIVNCPFLRSIMSIEKILIILECSERMEKMNQSSRIVEEVTDYVKKGSDAEE